MMRRRIAAATPYLTSRRSGACWSHAMMRTSAVAHAPSPTHAPLVRAPFVLHPLAEPRRLAHTHNPTAAPEGLLGDEEEKTLLRSAIEEIIAFQSEVAKKPVEVAAARARDKKATSLALRFRTNADALELMAEALNPHEIVRDLRFLSHFFFTATPSSHHFSHKKILTPAPVHSFFSRIAAFAKRGRLLSNTADGLRCG